MGHGTYIPKANSFSRRVEDQQNFLSAVHQAVVVDVHVSSGTVTVKLESIPFQDEVQFPLLGLSAPPDSTQTTADFKASSWGRYIPQVNDRILVAFDMQGNLHALGYAAFYYQGFEVADNALEDRGGIGWSLAKTVKPGDWDFMSARGATLYLGDKASLGSGPFSIVVNQFNSDTVLTCPLIIDRTGLSTFRRGSARRKVLPTDTDESYIYSTRATTAPAQEASFSVKWNGTPEGVELSQFALGDVIDDSGSVALIRMSSYGQPVRRYSYGADITGFIDAFEESFDALGNYELTANMATNYKWSTPLSTWEVSNLLTKISSTTSVTLDSVLVRLGSDSAVSQAVKGTEFISSLTTACSTISSLCSAIPPGLNYWFNQLAAASAAPPLSGLAAGFKGAASALAALQTAVDILNNQLNTFLSTKVFLE